jgi:hypothetical protein
MTGSMMQRSVAVDNVLEQFETIKVRDLKCSVHTSSFNKSMSSMWMMIMCMTSRCNMPFNIHTSLHQTAKFINILPGYD